MVRTFRSQQKVSEEFMKFVTAIRIECMKRGKRPPTVKQITKEMVKGMKPEVLLFDKFIRL